MISDTAEANSLPQSAMTVNVRGIPTSANTTQNALPAVVTGTMSPYPESALRKEQNV